MGLFTPGVNQTFSFLALYLVMILGNVGLVLLLKEETDKELLRLATYDDLTGSLNRRSFIVRANNLIDVCAKEKKYISYILFDIDYFKNINDDFGHEVGDRVLKELVERANLSISKNDLFCRYGGDEFAIFLNGANQSEAIEIAEKIRENISSLRSGIVPAYTLSMGIITLIPDQFT